ncbi:MAG: putative endonuclease [Candidatus Berkelbacteria bacterium Licking1014_2]|uniref:UPF0102 protein CEN88_357 n=1 Tax=Candidatus Berkelbacteria bacterium Licking1014_2 TaxID=2017146 RepID=A0A554LU73_9BACT|nr:MAG: putative endonuclease [Candidatus Berkelbacteria bacterium Licking1014_2]
MGDARKILGFRGEKRAVQFLVRKNYQILDQNLRLKFGEIDILAADGDDIVIVEVKTKTGDEMGNPLEQIDKKKRKKLLLLAREIYRLYPDRNIRIDAIGIEDNKIDHIKNAVGFE